MGHAPEADICTVSGIAGETSAKDPVGDDIKALRGGAGDGPASRPCEVWRATRGGLSEGDAFGTAGVPVVPPVECKFFGETFNL